VLGDELAVSGDEFDRDTQRRELRDRLRDARLWPVEEGQESDERQVVFIVAGCTWVSR
jgi:hypothetical protein